MTVVDPPIRERRTQVGALPPIGVWWPMLERTLQFEILEAPDAPLRVNVVRRIRELCELDGSTPMRGVRLNENERAYLAGWTHSVDWA
ncbi:hypothetical protein ET445_08285 [Agromyces protaetiae]|uniref:Uncharacterized protein n=1 Tax=Agromyces protaetiae TaxID=2509455 RepID=A0A4P6FEB1_9MICO|nr:hypothetical protein [Agromyces protaetiae]QAY73343.1 hypothetical protein ET445_08285 [Agromyces protaetiae]